jgi:uncharacterized protein YeaO (DUF488 family)
LSSSGKERSTAKASIGVLLWPSRTSSASTSPAAGPIWKPAPEKPKPWKRPGVVRLGPSTGWRSGMLPSVPLQVRMKCAWRSAGSSSMACVRERGDGVAVDARAVGIERIAPAAAEHEVAARHLPAVDAAALDAQAPDHEVRQRLGHHHHGMARAQRHCLAELGGEVAGPCARAVEQHRRMHLERIARAQHEHRAVVRHLVDLVALEDLRARALRRERESGRHQARVGLPVFHAQRAADRARAEPGAALAQARGGDQFEPEVEVQALARGSARARPCPIRCARS